MITLSSIALEVAFGGYLPLISLWLETLGISFQKIGIVSGMAALGIVSSAYFATWWRDMAIFWSSILGYVWQHQ